MFRSRSSILPFVYTRSAGRAPLNVALANAPAAKWVNACLTLALVSGCGFADPDDAASTTPPLSNSGTPQVVGMTSSGVGVLDTAGAAMLPVPMATQGANTTPIIGVPVAPVSTAPPADCGSDSQSANVKPLVLMFTFDVSASMGDGSQTCYDRTLKWEPVVAATKAFFADASSAGISATLTFFPAADPDAGGGGQGGFGAVNPILCQGDTYNNPDVPLTELPNPAFAAALDAVDPLNSGLEWRLGTPTGPGLEGTIAQIAELKVTQPDNKYVIVLVTDGAPALCDNATDSIDNVAAILADAAQDGIPTYVIGVDNPPAATPNPDDPMMPGGNTQCGPLSDNLQALAQGGGTDTALFIDTGDPLKTAADFKTAIDKIRDESLSCEVSIPNPPAGRVFDKDEVNVAYLDQSMTEHKLVYDPTCASPDAWRYDNETAPTTILLCDATCAAVQGMVKAELNVAFGCETARPTGG